MTAFGHPVVFNGGKGKETQLAFVLNDHGDGNLDLVVWEGSWTEKNSVPRRDPADYGAEGGGDTWHPVG